MTMNYGYPGSFSRSPDNLTRNQVAKGDIPFGAPLILNADNTFSVFDPAKTAADFVGVAVREVKQQTGYFSTDVLYKDGQPADCLTRGSCTVKVTSGTPSANSPVFIRIAENAAFPGSAVGDFVAEADGANTLELTNTVFQSGKIDGNGVAEITVLTRQA
jgi:hypothetical protein